MPGLCSRPAARPLPVVRNLFPVDTFGGWKGRVLIVMVYLRLLFYKQPLRPLAGDSFPCNLDSRKRDEVKLSTA